MEASDMEAIREALEELMKFTCNCCQERYCEEDVEEEDGQRIQSPCSVIIKARAALALPRRNCDVGTAVQQARRYHNLTDRYNPCSYRGYARCAEDCPVHIKLTQEGHGELLCQLEWAQMPYETQEDKEDK